MSFARENFGSTGTLTHGYFGGGRQPESPYLRLSTMHKITYSSDTSTLLPSGANLSEVLNYISAVSSRANGISAPNLI